MKEIAEFFKVLADEARLKILWLLFNHGELCVCDIMETLRITQSKASRHLATLRHARLVHDRKAGAWSYYSIVPAKNELWRGQLEALRAGLATHTGAARVLRDLEAWLARKERSATCTADDGARRAAASRARAGGGKR